MQLSLVRKWGERRRTTSSWRATTTRPSIRSPAPRRTPSSIRTFRTTTRSSSSSRYRVPRAVHRLAENLIQQVTRRQEKEYLPRPEDGWRVPDSNAARTSTPEYAILKTATRAPRSGQDRDVPGVLLVHASPADRRCCGRTASRSTTRTARATASGTRSADQQAQLDRQPHPLPAGRRIRIRRASTARGRTAIWRSGPSVLQAKGILRHGAKAKLKNARRSASP